MINNRFNVVYHLLCVGVVQLFSKNDFFLLYIDYE
jgi:hypothetical protein